MKVISALFGLLYFLHIGAAFSNSDCFDIMEYLKTKKQDEERGGPSLEVFFTDVEIDDFDDFGKLPRIWLERFSGEVKDVGMYVRQFYSQSANLSLLDCKQTNGSKIPFTVRSYTGNSIEFRFASELTYEYFKPLFIDQAVLVTDLRALKQTEDQFRRSLARSIDIREQSITKLLKSLRFSMSLRKDQNLDLEVHLETGDEETDFLHFHSKGVAVWGNKPQSVIESLNVQNFEYFYQQVKKEDL